MSQTYPPLSRALSGLFGAQFLGALNDHAFKTIVSLIVVERGLADGGAVEGLSLLGTLFVLPYILLAGIAGRTVDRFDTRRVLIATKTCEIFVMMLAAFALRDGRSSLLIGTLALMAVQSVFFSPAKYTMLPSLFAGRALVRANGLLELSRYVATIAGTALGGVAVLFARQNPEAIGLLLVVGAVGGTAFAVHVPAGRPAAGPGQTIGGCHGGIGRALGDLVRLRLLGVAALLTAVELVGTTLMFVLLLFSVDTLGFDETKTGFLAAGAGIGVGAGALLAGTLSRKPGDFRPAIAGALVAGGAVLSLPSAAEWIWFAPALVFLAGAGGGAVLVPLNTIVQVAAPAAARGRIIAANNFLNMLGVLVASGLLWLMGRAIALDPSQMLAAVGGAVVLATVCLTLRSARHPGKLEIPS